MRMKSLLFSVLLGASLVVGSAAYASETATTEAPTVTVDSEGRNVYTTKDGVLSITAPTEEWKAVEDPNYWFALSDGDDLITIQHLSNGEELPDVEVAHDEFEGIYQGFVSTKNEVFVVKGSAVRRDSLKEIMEAISTLKVLKLDTKKALQPEKTAEYTIRPINETYYCIGNDLRARVGWSVDERAIGHFNYGDAVSVKGAVQKNGQDIGWFQVDYNGTTAYSSSNFFSKTKPEAKKASTPAPTQKPAQTEDHSAESFRVYAEDGGWVNIFPVGNMYEDYNGLKYSNVRGDLYYDIQNDIMYSADPGYWTNGEPTPDDEEDDYDEYQNADDEVNGGYDEDYDEDYGGDDYEEDYDEEY